MGISFPILAILYTCSVRVSVLFLGRKKRTMTNFKGILISYSLLLPASSVVGVECYAYFKYIVGIIVPH